MLNKEKINPKKGIILWLFFAVVLLLINVPVIAEMGTIKMGSDEYNILSIAAYITGHDWSAYNQSINAYHGFGTSLFYVPLFYLFNDSHTIYKAALIVNSLLLSIVPLISYYLSKNCFKITNKLFRITISLFVAIYPYYLISNKYTWSENLFIVITWVNLLLAIKVVQNIDSDKYILWIILYSMTSGFSYMIHGRGIVFCILVPVTIIFALLNDNSRRKKSIFKYLCTIIIAMTVVLIMYLLNSYLIGFFKENLWKTDILRNTMDTLASDRVTYLKNWTGIKTMIKMIFGQVFYMVVVTLGISITAFVIFGCNIWRAFINKVKIEKQYLFLSIYLLLEYLGSLSISVLSLVSGVLNGSQRTDYVIYGRYTEAIFPILIWFVLIYCYWNKIKKYEIISGVMGTTVAVVGFWRFGLPLYLFMKSDGHSSIVSILSWLRLEIFSASDVEVKTTFYTVGAICIILSTIIALLLYSKQIRWIILICSCSFLYSYVYVSKEVTIPLSQKAYERTKDIRNFYEEYDIDEDILYFISKEKRYPSELQVELQDKNIMLLYDPLNPQNLQLEKLNTGNALILSEGNSFIDNYAEGKLDSTLFENAKYVKLENNYLIILGEFLQDELESQGCKLYDSWPG